MLVKLTCRGRDFPAAVARARRALAEFRIRGVSTNISVPAGRAGRPRLRRRRPDHLVHRRAAPAAEGAGLRGPRHQAAELARRRHGQQAQRRTDGPHGPGGQASGPRSRRRPGRGPASGCWSSARKASPRPCARRTPWPSPRPPSATRTSPCSPPGCAPATCVAAGPAVVQAAPGTALGRGLGRGDLRRRPALPRRRPLGPAGRRCARRCRTCACRCCSAAATPSATRPTRKR